MQILKESVKLKIIDNAKDEFLAKGYTNSSMRSIAKSSGITVGNLYRYFKCKKDLFSYVTEPAYKQLKQLFKHTHSKPVIKSFGNRENIEQLKKAIDAGTSLFSDYRRELLIIIDGSQGTKYEKAYEEILKLVENNSMYHLKSLKSVKYKDTSILSKAISTGFMEGIFEIVRRENDKRKIRSLISNYFTFFIKGFINVIK